jgi:hypothetical protein
MFSDKHFLTNYSLKIKLCPDWTVIRWLFHPASCIVDTHFSGTLAQPRGRQYSVNPQATPGFSIKTFAAIVEPAKTIIFIGIQASVRIL